ncbi:unnamed protein product [Sphagnum tenellum]
MYPTPTTDNEQLEMASASSNVADPADHLPSTAPPLPPGVGPEVSGGLACLPSSCTPQSVLLPPKSVAAAETIVPSFPPLPQHVEVSQDP